MSAATLTRHEAAAYLGISVDTLDRLRAAGRLLALQVSARLVRYRQADLDAYLEQCRARSAMLGPLSALSSWAMELWCFTSSRG